MSTYAIGGIVFACVFGGALLGLLMRRVLPEPHLSPESRDAIKLSMGLVSTLTALVLGLLLASAKGSYDTERTNVAQLAARVEWLDRLLALYGPETAAARAEVKAAATRMVDALWPSDGVHRTQTDPLAARAEMVYPLLQGLDPNSDAKRELKAQAISAARELGQMRWLLHTQTASAVSMPVVMVVVFWLTIIFISFGLFAPLNVTVVGAILVCAFSVSGAIFLILELDAPFGGLIQISDAPMRDVLAHLGR